MTSFATDSNNDLFLGPDNNLAMVDGVAECAQNTKAAVECQFGECVLDLSRGVPTDATVWSRYRPMQFAAYAKKMIAGVLHVTGVKSFNQKKIGDQLFYTATYTTDLDPRPTTITGTV